MWEELASILITVNMLPVLPGRRTACGSGLPACCSALLILACFSCGVVIFWPDRSVSPRPRCCLPSPGVNTVRIITVDVRQLWQSANGQTSQHGKGYLRVEVHIQSFALVWIWMEVLVEVLVVQRLVMRVQVRVRQAFLPQWVMRWFTRTCGRHRRGLWVGVHRLRVGVLAGWWRCDGKVLGVRPLRVVLRIGVVSLIRQFAAELSQRRTPAAFIVLLWVGSHLVVSRDDAGLFLQNTEHQALPFG